MDSITQAIINSSMQSVDEEEPEGIEDAVCNSIEELYEEYEPSPRVEMEKELLKAAILEPEEEEPKREPNTDIDGYYDPYPKTHHKSAEAEMQDRLLTVPRRPKNAPWGSLWVIKTGFLEQVALLNLTKSEQRGLLRQWEDIQVLSEGDGNECIVEAEQDKFMLKIVSYKSRSDNPEKGIRERTAHITNKTISDQTVQMPKGEQQRSGFLNTILGRKIQS